MGCAFHFTNFNSRVRLCSFLVKNKCLLARDQYLNILLNGMDISLLTFQNSFMVFRSVATFIQGNFKMPRKMCLAADTLFDLAERKRISLCVW